MKIVQACLLISAGFLTTAFGDSFLSQPRTIELPFAAKPDADRGYTDIRISDPALVARADAFQIDFDCDRPEAVGNMTLYFQSGKGWYSCPVKRNEDFGEVEGRFRLTVAPLGARTEGTPGSWDEVNTIRFAVWRGAAKDATVKLLRIQPVFYPVVAVRPEKEPSFHTDMLHRLNRIGVPAGTISSEDLENGKLDGRRLVILPHNPGLSSKAVENLRRFVEQDGKLIAFYQLPPDLMRSLGFEPGKYLKSPEGVAALAEVRFRTDLPEDDPFRSFSGFGQKSWNINTAKPMAEAYRARIEAWWYDAAGRRTEYPAMLLSDRGAFFSHVLTGEDRDNKDRFLSILIGHFEPSFHREVLARAWGTLFTVGDPRDMTVEKRKILEKESFAELKRRGFDPGADFFEETNEKAKPLGIDRFQKLLETLAEMRQEAVARYCASIPAKSPEFRAWWEHAGLGAYHGDWNRTMKELSEAGFNAVISNLLWGGSAHYASDVLQRSKKFEQYGDQIEQAVKAGKKYGVEVHAWQVCYRLTGSTPEYIETMKQAGRTQKRYDGEVGDWLCPSHPENIDLECAAFCELARKYPDLTGIHYDYIRYPDGEHCYCEGCRDRFSKETGCEITEWPKDVRYGGAHREKYEQWRCDTISRLVERVHREAKAIRPSIRISAAVFNSYPSCRRGIGQDWALWVEKGWLDFICPMNYTTSNGSFENLIERQKELIQNRIPLYPGIGATATGIQMTPDRVAAQIRIAREAGCPGFVIFNLDGRTIQKIPPMLKLGPTKP